MLPRLALICALASSAVGDPSCNAQDEVSMLQQSLALSAAKAKEATSIALAGAKAVDSTAAGQLVAASSGDDAPVSYGSSACRCLGIDHTEGFAIASISGNNVIFPSDIGSRCAAWDEGTHPDCLADSPPDWCFQQWCYVDPCSCDTSALPPTQSYFVGAEYQQVPIHFSYETCGATDSYTADYYTDACLNKKTETDCLALSKCSWSLSLGCVGSSLSGINCDLLHQTDQWVWGQETCACVNIANIPGQVNATSTSNVAYTYPESVGSTCTEWDEEVHPDCIGSGEKPAWCSQKWCYVDPCACSSVTPVVSSALPGATFHGYTLYYSYDTCGAADTYTGTDNLDACVNQKTEEACAAQSDKCLWSNMGGDVGYVCRGLEVATYCAQTTADVKSGAAQLESTSASLALLATAIVLMRVTVA